MEQSRIDNHHCHATGCTAWCAPEKLMCLKHWRMVPTVVQRTVWQYYRVGQCDDMRPSAKWHEAADAAIGCVALLEGRPVIVQQLMSVMKFKASELGEEIRQAMLKLIQARSRKLVDA